MKIYDIVILGSGPAGYVGALRAAQKGASTAIVEKKGVGGVCLNEGCIPTKALLDVSHTSARVRHFSGKGISGSVSIDLAAAVAQKDMMVKKLSGGVEFLLKGRKVDILKGKASIAGAGEIAIEGVGAIGYRKLVICTGSDPVQIPTLLFDGENIISSREALGLKQIPESMVIVGGGYIGCEFADLFAGLGTKVTLVEMLPEILPNMDRDLAGPVVSELEKEGVDFLLDTKVEKASVAGGKVSLELSSGSSIEAAKVLVAVGRRPNVDLGDLSALGIQSGSKGIDVNERCVTGNADVYAAGDVTAKMMLAHAASRQAEVAVENALGGDTSIEYSLVPQCIFASPEVSSVGLSEAAAREEGLDVKTAKFPYAAIGRAIVTGDDNGFVKVIGGEDGDVVGLQVVGRNASEIVAIGGLAIQVGATIEDLAEMIVMHPTFAEAVKEAADVWLGIPLHTK